MNAALMTVRLRLVYDKGSLSFSRLDLGATDEQLVELASAFNSLQDRPLQQVVRTDVTRILL